jgi:hypothetical protein
MLCRGPAGKATARRAHGTYPQWRLGQLVANVTGWCDQEVWDVEDEQLLEAARLHLHQATSSATKPASRIKR